MINKLLFSILLVLSFNTSFAQKADSTNIQKHQFNYKPYIVPAALIIYGSIDPGHISSNIQSNIQRNHPGFKTSIDDYIQYAPLLSTVALGLFDLKTKNDFINRSLLTGISIGSTAAVVTVLKRTAKKMRPDGSANNSFPSGHAATAFMGAEILHQELKDNYPVWSYAGYPVAAAVGVLRMYNQKHYLSDVLTGAGIGILCTKATYALFKQGIVKNQHNTAGLSLAPTMVFGQSAICLSMKL